MNIRSILCALAIATTCSACKKPQGTVLGKAPRGETRTVLAIRDGITPPDVALHGKIVEKCPTAGCWFYLSDGTGALKVDTKSAGFVVTKIALQTEVTVSGKIIYEGNEPILTASGLRY